MSPLSPLLGFGDGGAVPSQPEAIDILTAYSYDKPQSYAIIEAPLPVVRDNDVLVRALLHVLHLLRVC